MSCGKTKVAVITGGTRGIGAAMVAAFYSSGFTVYYTGKSEPKTPIHPGTAHFIPLDLLDEDSVAGVCLAMRAGELRPDVLVNNAGINIIEPIDILQDDSWESVIQVNLTGAMKLGRAAAQGMMSGGVAGRILNISSIWGVVSRGGRAAYSAAKTGLIGMTRAMALDLAPHGILVNALCPGFTDTELTRASLELTEIAEIEKRIPLGRMARVEEIARGALFLCSGRNTYITGQTLVIDGGFTIQ